MQQVAEYAGVSTQTVSNVLNNRAGRVSEATRRRVLSALQELDYIPISRPAMQNRHVPTHAIGVVFLDDVKFLEDTQERVGLNTFAGMRRRAHDHQYDLLVLFRSRSQWLEPGGETQFLDRRYDGIIFVGHCPRRLADTLVRHALPTVVCYCTDTPPGVVSVMADNRMAMQLAVDHLIDHGHERIAHFAGPLWSTEASFRRDACCAALQAAGRTECTERIVQAPDWDGDIEEMRPSAEAVLAMHPTAVVCANDFLALNLWQAAEERGMRVPDDLSLIGMDNMDVAVTRGLTSIVNPFHEIGSQAIDALLQLIKGGDADNCQRIPVTLVPRNSVARPANGPHIDLLRDYAESASEASYLHHP